MPRVRKTKRYYIDEINKSMSFAFNSLEEIIKKYGDKVIGIKVYFDTTNISTEPKRTDTINVIMITLLIALK